MSCQLSDKDTRIVQSIFCYHCPDSFNNDINDGKQNMSSFHSRIGICPRGHFQLHKQHTHTHTRINTITHTLDTMHEHVLFTMGLERDNKEMSTYQSIRMTVFFHSGKIVFKMAKISISKFDKASCDSYRIVSSSVQTYSTVFKLLGDLLSINEVRRFYC